MAGKWADKGHVKAMTGFAFATGIVSMVTAGIGHHHLVPLILGAVLLDAAVQVSLLGGQSIIFKLDDGARSRINSAFMATFFLGGAIGSQAGSWAFHAGGFTAVAVFAAALPLFAFLLWLTEPRSKQAVPA